MRVVCPARLNQIRRRAHTTRLSHPTPLQKVRDLSREQFFAVAHVNKIYRTQQAAIVAARGAAQQQQLQQQQHQQLYQQQAPPGQFAGPISYPVLPGQRK